MSIELVATLLVGAAAFVSFYLAYKGEASAKRRAWLLGGFALTCAAGLLGIEEYVRKTSMENLPQELDREWLVLLETPINAIELEVLSPDGLTVPSLLTFARGVRFSIAKVDLYAKSYSSRQGDIDFGPLFSPDNLLKGARVGSAVATIVSSGSEKKRTIERINNFDCVASDSNIIQMRSKPDWKSKLEGVCSAAVSIKPSGDHLLLRSIGDSPKVRVSLKAPNNLKCLGPCENGPLISVRLLLRAGDPVLPIMIEISPSLLLPNPSQVSEATHTLTYEISGRTVLDLAKSHFMQSAGYREHDHFRFTKGLVDAVLRKLTTRTATFTSIDVVWTTSSSPAESTVLGAIAPDMRAGAEAIRASEWCGFGQRTICWHRFLVMRPSK